MFNSSSSHINTWVPRVIALLGLTSQVWLARGKLSYLGELDASLTSRTKSNSNRLAKLVGLAKKWKIPQNHEPNNLAILLASSSR
jgi:hypothetical protein